MTAVAERSGPGHPAPAWVVRRRRRVPNGRSLLGALLVAASAVVVFTAWLDATSHPGQPWVVAGRPLAAGTTLDAADLTTLQMRLAPATAAGGFAVPTLLIGRTLAAPLAAGSLVTGAALVPAGGQPSLRPVALSVDPSESAPLEVGGLVDVLVTNGSAPSATTTVVVRGARMISRAGPSSSLVGDSDGEVITLGVSSLAEVTAIVHAERTGTLGVVAGEPSDGSGLGPPPAAGAGS